MVRTISNAGVIVVGDSGGGGGGGGAGTTLATVAITNVLADIVTQTTGSYNIVAVPAAGTGPSASISISKSVAGNTNFAMQVLSSINSSGGGAGQLIFAWPAVGNIQMRTSDAADNATYSITIVGGP